MIDETANIEELRRIAPDLAPSISKLRVPAYILDRTGTVRWMNAAALRHFGDLRGRKIAQIVVPQYLTLAKLQFAEKVIGTAEATEGRVTIRGAGGQNVKVDVSSTQLREGDAIVGVFGLADPSDEPLDAVGPTPHLTPRQLDVLRHLAAGQSTEHIARSLGIANETVRNHVRGIHERLDVHTRLGAVIRAHELGLV